MRPLCKGEAKMSSHIVYPRPAISTLHAVAWLAVLFFAVSITLLAMHYGHSGQPMQHYLMLMTFVFATSMIWLRCFRVLRRLERDRTEPDEGMTFLFDLMLQLPLVQLIGVLAAMALA
jgi:hypothetical protein